MTYFRSVFLLALTSLIINFAVASEARALLVTRWSVNAQPQAGNLECRGRMKPVLQPKLPNVDPAEFPDDADIEEALATRQIPGIFSQIRLAPLAKASVDSPLKVAIWGDSHLAAGFFTEELTRLTGIEAGRTRAVFLPANMNRAGVRLPLRASCVSAQWRTEMTYTSAGATASPGPGLVNLFSSAPGSSLEFDLRSRAGVAEVNQVRILYEVSELPSRIAVSVDDGPEKELIVGGVSGPAALELAANAPLSVVRIRLVEGQFRFHGLRQKPPDNLSLQLDVFGMPGATAAGWKNAAVNYLAAWFSEDHYDLVILEYGTNEGNAAPFDVDGYKQMLILAVGNVKRVFPDAACVLIAPGDRGVLIRRSLKLKRPAAKQASEANRQADRLAVRGAGKLSETASDTALSHAGLFKYSQVHEQIERIQQEVGASAGCQTWSALNAMGGRGAAYVWAREKPPLMAPDLLHFTVKGYQRLAQEFAKSIGWNADEMWTPAAVSQK